MRGRSEKIFGLIFTVLLAFSTLNAIGQENCNNGIDDDSDGLVDCNDGDCQFASNIERGCNCDDGSDNDGDGLTDMSDADCADFYGLTFVGETSDCSLLPPDSLNFFDYIDDLPVKTQQNTVDTQSKMAIGDLNGDGLPEVVATSKWGKAVRVISSGDHVYCGDLKERGEVVHEFGVTGQDDIFEAKGGLQVVYELEVAIADIDRDGYGEIFALASARASKGKPGEEELGAVDHYYIVGLKFNPATCEMEPIPTFNGGEAVNIGSGRPGIFGLTDFDGDGLVEIYLKDRIYAAETGAWLADGNTGRDWENEVNSAPVAVDIISGGNQELVCGDLIYSVPSLSNRNPGSPAALAVAHSMNDLGFTQFYPKVLNDPQEYGITNFSSTSVADMNGDGNLDVVLSGADPNDSTAVFFWDVSAGHVSFYIARDPTKAGGWPWGTSRPNLGDADGDGELDIVVIAGNQLFALTINGANEIEELWATPRTLNDSRSGIVAVTIYDFDNDGKPEIVYRDSQQLVIVDGETGQNVYWATTCQSHTMTEGPIIADVDGDGGTDICVPCNTSTSFDIEAKIQQQALGGLNIFYSEENLWLPTRQVWNQSGYFVVNVNDDLTIPFPQFDQTMIFGTEPCFDGQVGPVRPLNVFLNQVPTLGPDGCPVFPAPDVAFVGDNPNAQPGDPDYVDPSDPSYFPAVDVIPPVCGDLEIKVKFNIINDGSLTINSIVPVSFFDGDPSTDPQPDPPATLLYQYDLNLVNFQIGDTLTDSTNFNSTGKAFRLYIVLNDDGATIPISIDDNPLRECKIGNNIYYFDITPEPFDVYTLKIQDDTRCYDSIPANGELKAIIIQQGDTVTDYSNFAFQWYDGPDTTTTIPAPQGTLDVITGLDSGKYTLIVTNTEKGCSSLPIVDTLDRIGSQVTAAIQEIQNQSLCDPPNGILEAVILSGTATYTYEWYDRFFTPLGITGSTANNLEAGEYIVRVIPDDGCPAVNISGTLSGPIFPTVSASVLQHVEDCENPDSGVITATAYVNGVPQDSADFTFNWHEWDTAADDVGSELGPENGTGPTRFGLAAGEYAIIVLDDSTGCESDPPIRVTIEEQKVYPVIVISELTPQTSCDPAHPNGRLIADVYDTLGTPQDPANFTFEWYEGDNTLPANLMSTVSGTNGQIADSVAAQGFPYTVKVINQNNCATILLDTSLSETLINPVVTVTSVNNSICDSILASGGNFNGSVNASISYDGSVVPDYTGFTIDWYRGEVVDSDSIITSTNPEGDTLLGLNEGRYTIVVTKDLEACSSTPIFGEVFDTLAYPVILLTEVAATNCDPAFPNGELTANVDVGGTPTINGHSFFWYEGIDTGPTGTPVASTSGTKDETALLLQPDSVYSIRVLEDNTGCVNTLSHTLTNASEKPIISLSASGNSICDTALVTVTQYNGAAGATVTDKTIPVNDFTDYTFTWHDGNTTVDPVLTTTNPDGDTLRYLPGGFYTAVVQNDALGCVSDPVTIEVKDTLILPTIEWVTITPATNCEGPDNGAIESAVDVGGGTLVTNNYTFDWYEGTTADLFLYTNPNASGLNGTQEYTVEVTNDLTGCVNTRALTLPDSSKYPVIQLTQTPNTICDPVIATADDYNGLLSTDLYYNTVLVADYTNYFFKLFDGTDTLAVNLLDTKTAEAPVFTELDSGDYTVRAYESILGCYSDPITLRVDDDFVLPVIQFDEISATNCDPALPNGQVTATVTGSTANYIFKWVSGTDVTGPERVDVTGADNNISLKMSPDTTYTVKVTTDSTGCFETKAIIVSDTSEVPVITLDQVPNTVCDPALTNPAIIYNGEVTGSVAYKAINPADLTGVTLTLYTGTTTAVVNGVSPLTQNLQDFSYAELDSGYYTVTAMIDSLGCESPAINIKVADSTTLPNIAIVQVPSTNCDPLLANGQATASGDGADGLYTFKWVPGVDTTAASIGAAPLVTGLTGGDTYTVILTTDSSGCINTEPVTILDEKTLPAVTLGQVPNTVCDPALTNPAIIYNGEVTGSVAYKLIDPADLTGVTLTLYTGKTTAVVNGASPLTQNLQDFIYAELDSGFYTVTAMIDSLGCESPPINIQVADSTTLPNIAIVQVGSTNCDPLLANGQATASGDGADGLYTFKWVAGVDTTAASIGAAPLVTGLTGGDTYTVILTTDSSGCINTEPVTILDEKTLPAVTLGQVP
ncbi:FG-GAP-like repeat-containing protein, partial [Bacteroidota bacterium]